MENSPDGGIRNKMKKIILWLLKIVTSHLDEVTSLDILREIVKSKSNKLDAQSLKEVTDRLRG